MSSAQYIQEPKPSEPKNTFIASIHPIKALAMPVMQAGCGQMRDPPHGQKQRQEQAI